jgi:hypothetical protein
MLKTSFMVSGAHWLLEAKWSTFHHRPGFIVAYGVGSSLRSTVVQYAVTFCYVTVV